MSYVVVPSQWKLGSRVLSRGDVVTEADGPVDSWRRLGLIAETPEPWWNGLTKAQILEEDPGLDATLSKKQLIELLEAT